MANPSTTIEIDGLPDFWDQLRHAEQTLLLLDYDGTLAPFHPDRMQAKPLDGVLEALDQLIALDDTTVALVSGRPVAEIQQLIGLDDVIIAGTHGFELYRPDTGLSRPSLPDRLSQALDTIQGISIEIVGSELTERKVATVALHTRKLNDENASRAAAAFRRLVAPYLGIKIELRDFDGGVEARVRGRDKGVAIQELIADLPPADLIAYIGDDDTDEDAFRALPSHGIGIKVGNPDAPTTAPGRLSDSDDVLQFLTNWIAIRTCQPTENRQTHA